MWAYRCDQTNGIRHVTVCPCQGVANAQRCVCWACYWEWRSQHFLEEQQASSEQHNTRQVQPSRTAAGCPLTSATNATAGILGNVSNHLQKDVFFNRPFLVFSNTSTLPVWMDHVEGGGSAQAPVTATARAPAAEARRRLHDNIWRGSQLLLHHYSPVKSIFPWFQSACDLILSVESHF